MTVEVDFGWHFEGTVDGGLRFYASWEAGAWEYSELEDLLQGVIDLDSRLASNDPTKEGPSFSERVGRATVERVHGMDLRRWAYRNLQTLPWDDSDAQALTLGRSVTLYDTWATTGDRVARRRVVVHEMAHVWDAGGLLSGGIGPYVGREPRVNAAAEDYGRREHWAETAASWVYAPDELGARHQEYMSLAVEGAPQALVPRTP